LSLTTDKNDPRLGHGVNDEPVPQNEAYLVLSEEERSKGFVRPLRTTYQHVGAQGPQYPLRSLTVDEKIRYQDYGYYAFEQYPEDPDSSVVGRFWTEKDLREFGVACFTYTTMAKDIAETYAREPTFYGATYCARCMMHKPVAEFVWEDGTRVGS
jgi:hypothetical protein